MRRFSLGFLVWLTGCYSPAYIDCAITCPDGETCPDGFQCEPSLKVCRPQGASGSCPAPGGDANRDAVNGDGSTDAPVFGMYCMNRGTSFLFCQDFDSGTLQQQGWAVMQGGQGTAMLSTPGVSLQQRFEAAVPNDLAHAQIHDSFVVSQPTYTQISIFFQMIELERAPGTMKTLFALRAGSTVQIELYSTGPGSLLAQVNGQTASVAFAPVANAWSRYELRFVPVGGGGSGSGSGSDAGIGDLYANFYVDNNNIATLGLVAAPSPTTAWDMYFGLGAGSGNNSPMRFGYDNVEAYLY